MSDAHEVRHRVGENNVRFAGFDVHRTVFFVSAALVLLMVGWVIAFPAAATDGFAAALSFVTTQAGWLMASLANLFVLFCAFLVVSPYGSVRLGGRDARPEFSDLSWFAMLFAAGMGIGMVFYSVAEPIPHFSSAMAAVGEAAGGAPLGGAAGDVDASTRLAMAATIFHWTVHPWSIFAVVAVGLAFFGKVRVPTLEGSAELTLPPAVNTQKALRLKGKGLHGNGDLYASLKIVLPEKGDPDLESLMRFWRDQKPYKVRD